MIELPTESEPVSVVEGDALDVMRAMPDGCVDAVITDPPYPCIKRPYGYWTEAEWFALMTPVVEECRRALKPSGSAVFVLQPNSERIGRMRTWLWRFMHEWGERWGMVQDAWWWNTSAMPRAVKGQLTPSVKACVWLGGPDCYRDPASVVRPPRSRSRDRTNPISRPPCGWRGDGVEPKRHDRRNMYAAQTRNGGSWPINLLPFGGGKAAGVHGHGAGTPLSLARWWTRYICPPGGLVLDPFGGSGTTGVATLKEGRRCLLIERVPAYAEIARKRVAAALAPAN